MFMLLFGRKTAGDPLVATFAVTDNHSFVVWDSTYSVLGGKDEETWRCLRYDDDTFQIFYPHSRNMIANLFRVKVNWFIDKNLQFVSQIRMQLVKNNAVGAVTFNQNAKKSADSSFAQTAETDCAGCAAGSLSELPIVLIPICKNRASSSSINKWICVWAKFLT